MASLAHRLTSVALVIALFGSPAVLSACMALCVDSPVAASTTDTPRADHDSGHGVMAEPAAVSAHAHDGTAASTQPTASVADASPPVPSDTRLPGSCDDCCVASPAALAAGPSVERTDGKAFVMAPTVLPPAPRPAHKHE